MNKFITELRRREVFRTAGLYVGICWIGIEAADILLPTFDAPEWIFRGIIIAAFAGFPIMLVLAWFYDVTDDGIEKTMDHTDTVVAPIGRGKGDFVVIGVLVVALAFSVYLNFARTPAGEATALEPLSVLIADFDNQTGDDVFDGALEQALQIGLEAAPFVSTFSRTAAKSIASEIRPDKTAMDEEAARLVSAREGIDVVMVGSIVDQGGGYELDVKVVNGLSGEEIANTDTGADNKSEVLGAINELAESIRRSLGDEVRSSQEAAMETITASSLEAMKAYTLAQEKATSGDYEGSLEHYRQAVELDGNFGRAYCGWALSLFTLGRTEEANARWEDAIARMGTMTERERLRTLGVYYLGVTRNFDKAVETLTELVDKYPADNSGRNNLALASFYTLDFDAALEQGREAHELYPRNEVIWSNLALYAMYAGDFETASQEAKALLEENGSYTPALLPIAMAANAADDWPAAEAAYARMQATGGRGPSMANLGLADLALFRADTDRAIDLLQDGIALDIESNNPRSAAIKRVMLGKAQGLAGDEERAARTLNEAARGGGTAILVPAALALVELGELDAAAAIATDLGESLQKQRRAYASLVEARIALASGDNIAAIDKLSAGLDIADLWLLRLHRGQAYLRAEAYVEALDEFRLARARIGEATAVFLDDQPTWHVTALLPFYTAEAQAALGMQSEAAVNLSRFLEYREAGPEAEAARSRRQ